MKVRTSIYVSKETLSMVDKAFKETRHNLYPQDFEKGQFLDQCFLCAIKHIKEVQHSLMEANKVDE